MTKNKEKVPDFTGGKYPVMIGGSAWQTLKAVFTGLGVMCAFAAWKYHWLALIPTFLFGFVAFNFWYLEILKHNEEKRKNGGKNETML